MSDIGPAQAGESVLPDDFPPQAPAEAQSEPAQPTPAPSLAEVETANYQRTLGE